jgi:drug/metabolite transporter (DMT)-like permease
MSRSSAGSHAITISIVTVLIWSGSYIFAKFGLYEIPPITFALLRFAIAFPAIALLLVLRGSHFNLYIVKKHFLLLSTLALTGVTLNFVLQFYSLKFITATAAAVIINTSVVFIAVLSMLFLGENMSWRKNVGMFLAFVGIYLVMSKDSWNIFSLGVSELIGYFLMIAASACWAAYSVLGKRIVKKYSPMLVTTIVFGLGTAYLVPFSIMEYPWPSLLEISPLGWSSVLYLAIPCSTVAYVLWYESLKWLEATKVAVFLYMIPVFTLVFSHIFLGESLLYSTILGIGFVIAGVHLTQIG